MGIDHQPLQSSMLTSGGHDGESKAEVRFANGKLYTIHDITPEDFQVFVDAESQGKHFNQHIKPHYRVELVPDGD